MNFIFQILIVIIIMFASYLLAPKPKKTYNDPGLLERPTSEFGIPIPELWGTRLMKSSNVLAWADNTTRKITITVKQPS